MQVESWGISEFKFIEVDFWVLSLKNNLSKHRWEHISCGLKTWISGWSLCYFKNRQGSSQTGLTYFSRQMYPPLLWTPCSYHALHRLLKAFTCFAFAHAVPLAWNVLPPLCLVNSGASSSLTQVALPLPGFSRLLQKPLSTSSSLLPQFSLDILWDFTTSILIYMSLCSVDYQLLDVRTYLILFFTCSARTNSRCVVSTFVVFAVEF